MPASDWLGGGGTAPRRHAEFYLALAEDTVRAYHCPGERAAFEQIGREQENLRAALRWLLVQGESDLAQRLVGARCWFWMQRRDLAEARGWLDSVARPAAPGPTWQSAQLLYLLASVAWLQGDYPSAQSAVHRSLAIARAVASLRWEHASSQRPVRPLANSEIAALESGDLWTQQRGQRISVAEGDFPTALLRPKEVSDPIEERDEVWLPSSRVSWRSRSTQHARSVPIQLLMCSWLLCPPPPA
jgi:hypothetical protein